MIRRRPRRQFPFIRPVTVKDAIGGAMGVMAMDLLFNKWMPRDKMKRKKRNRLIINRHKGLFYYLPKQWQKEILQEWRSF